MVPFKGKRLPLRLFLPISPLSSRSCIRRIPVQPRSLRPLHTTRTPFNQYDSSVFVENVRVRKKIFTRRRFLLLMIYGLGTYSLAQFVLGKLLDEDEAAEETHENHKDDDEAGEGDEVDEDGNIIRIDHDDSIFIPFQYPRKLPQSFYRTSDPEWQEFVRLDRNKEKQKKLKDELAAKISIDVPKVQKVRAQLGNNVKVTKYWLDVKFPDGPPPEYARSGIEIGDEFIAWSTQIIPQSHYTQLHHFMWPRAVFLSAYAALELFYRLQVIKVKSAFGAEYSDLEKTINAHIQWQRTRNEQRKTSEDQQLGKGSNPPGPTATGDQKPSSSQSQHQPPAASQLQKPPASASPASTPSRPAKPPQRPTSTDPNLAGNAPMHPILPSQAATLQLISSMPVSSDLQLSWRIFSSTLALRWGRTRIDRTPRGCFFVLGVVELQGSRGRCKVDVTAAFDPGEAKWTGVNCKVKQFWEHRQTAKGGP